jgi:hypothetical protein
MFLTSIPEGNKLILHFVHIIASLKTKNHTEFYNAKGELKNEEKRT